MASSQMTTETLTVMTFSTPGDCSVESDCEEFTVSKKAALMNGTIKNLVDGLSDESVIPIPNVDKSTLLNIMEWCEHYVEKDEDDNEFKYDHDFDSKFLDKYTKPEQNSKSILNVNVLVELLEAANYMSNKNLLHVVCQKFADCIRGKSIEEIQKDYGICSDCRGEGMCDHGLEKTAFTEEEEKEMRKIKPYEEWVKELEEEQKKKD